MFYRFEICSNEPPIFVDAYTKIDNRVALCTHLKSTTYSSPAKTQRIRANPANRDRAARNCVDLGQEPFRAVKLTDKYLEAWQNLLIN